MDEAGQFYLGRVVDPSTGQTGNEPLLYDSEDLTTHGVVVGMTGSGKTGLCIGLLEEAAARRRWARIEQRLARDRHNLGRCSHIQITARKLP